MNLAEIRTRIFNQIDWAPTTSTEAVTRTNDFINRAYEQLCLEAPFCFFESEVKLSTEPDIKSNDSCSTDNATDPIPPAHIHFFETSGVGIADRLFFMDEWPEHPSTGAFPTQRYAEEMDWMVANGPIGADTTQDTNESIRNFGPNPWVLMWNFVGGKADWQAFVNAGGIIPAIDGSWDGRKIDLQDPNGEWHTNRVREVWCFSPEKGGEKESAPTPLTYCLALWYPFPAEQFAIINKKTDTYGHAPTYKYRIYTEEYYFPDDMIKAHSIVINDQNRTYPIDVILQEEAEQFSLTDHFEMASGIPSVSYRRSHFQLPAPNTAPAVMQYAYGEEGGDSIMWRGPEPPGTFSYVVTYCIGARDLYNRHPGPAMFDENYTNNFFKNEAIDFSYIPGGPSADLAYNPPGPSQPAANRFREPLWESAPSPISAEITVTIPDESMSPAMYAITIQPPNIAFMLGMLGKGRFAESGGGEKLFLRRFFDHCGIRVRIYRRRHTQDWDNYPKLVSAAPAGAAGAIYESLEAGFGTMNPPPGHIEISDAYYLQAELQLTDKNRGLFIDDGQIHPDYNRRLRDVHGYQSMGLYPVPDKRYKLKVRCLRRPPKLVDDQDAPLIHAEACNALIDLAASYWYEAEGVPEMAVRMRERYDRGIFDLKKRYGNLQSQANPHLKRLSRAKAGFRRTRPLRKWWTSP